MDRSELGALATPLVESWAAILLWACAPAYAGKVLSHEKREKDTVVIPALIINETYKKPNSASGLAPGRRDTR